MQCCLLLGGHAQARTMRQRRAEGERVEADWTGEQVWRGRNGTEDICESASGWRGVLASGDGARHEICRLLLSAQTTV
jgi:hypothetical protein